MKTQKIISIVQIKRGLKTRLSRKLQGQRRLQYSAPISKIDSDGRGGDGRGGGGVGANVTHPVASRDEMEDGRGSSVSTENRQIPDPNAIDESLRSKVDVSVDSSAPSSGSESRGIIVDFPKRAAGKFVDDGLYEFVDNGLNEKAGMHSVAVDFDETASVYTCGALSVHTDDGLYWNWCCGRRLFAPDEFTLESEHADAAEIAYSNKIYIPQESILTQEGVLKCDDNSQVASPFI